MAYVTLPANLQDMFGSLNDRINKLESGPNSVVYEPMIDYYNGTSTVYPKIGSVNYSFSGASSNLTLDFQNPPPIGYVSTSVVLMKNGTTAYYPTAFKVSGTTVSSIQWSPQAPTFGHVSATDIYTFTFHRFGTNDWECYCYATVVSFV
jgi:hypothetical protein